MEHATTLPTQHAHDSPINPTREENRAIALEQLTSRVSTEERYSAECKAVRRRRRRTAGRCGGQFMVEWDRDRPIYHYASTDAKERFIDRLVTWVNRRSIDTSSTHTVDNEPISFESMNEQSARKSEQGEIRIHFVREKHTDL